MLKLKQGTANHRPPRWLLGRRPGCQNFSKHDAKALCLPCPGFAAFATEGDALDQHPNDLLYHEDTSLHQPGTGGLSLPDCLSQCSASQVRLTLLKKKIALG